MRRHLHRAIPRTWVAATSLALVWAPVHRASADSASAPPPTPATVTLEALLKEAMQRSPGVQAKQRAYEAARTRVVAAWLPEDPMIGADVEGQSHLFRFDRTDNEYVAQQTIPFPTTLLLRARSAAQQARMAYQQYREAERDVAWHIEQPYQEWFLATRTLAVLEDTQSLAERLAHAVQAKYESNQANQQDLLKARIESSKVGLDRYDWREKVHLAEAHLSHILDRPLETVYALSEAPRSPAPSLSATELGQIAVRQRPELKAMEIGIARAKTARWLAATKWLPDVTGRIEARQFSGEGSIREYDTFIGLTVPVWSLLKGASGEWKGAGEEVGAAEAAYTEMRNEVLLAVHQAYAKVKIAGNALTTYETLILPEAKQQVEVALSSYEAGRSDLLSLIDAERMLKESQIAYYTRLADYEVGLAELRLAIGGGWSS